MPSRRHFLRASGLSLALPMLPSLTRQTVHAAPHVAASVPPTRMCYLYVPNGVNMRHWRPSSAGDSFELNRSTAALADVAGEVSFIEGLRHQNGTSGRDGAGDHARAHATYLTAARPRKTAGTDIHLGVSADQLVAQRIGEATRLPSLELSCDGVRRSGSCDSGYACAYQFNLSWADDDTPVSPEDNPRLVFERLFGDGDHGERTANYQRRQAQQKSMLDFLSEEAKFIDRQLGGDDRQKLDEYFTAVRDIERRIEKSEAYGVPADPDRPTPPGIPTSYRDHIRLMMDVLSLALETDSTRVASFMLAHDGSNRSFPDIEIGDGHHDLSHHKKNPERLEKIARIDQFYVEQFAYFLKKLKSSVDSEGNSLLDHTMVLYGSGICDGDRHNHDDLPVIAAGGEAIGWKQNKYRRFKGGRPMADLHLDMIRRMGVEEESFGDSAGVLDMTS